MHHYQAIVSRSSPNDSNTTPISHRLLPADLLQSDFIITYVSDKQDQSSRVQLDYELIIKTTNGGLIIVKDYKYQRLQIFLKGAHDHSLKSKTNALFDSCLLCPTEMIEDLKQV